MLMSTLRKQVLGAAVATACLSSGLIGCAQSQSGSLRAEDTKVLGEIREAYLKGMNSAADPATHQFSDFVDRYMAPDFQGTVLTGQHVKSAQEFKACMGKLSAFIGLDRTAEPKGKYEVKDVDVQSRYVTSDMIVSVGATKEFVRAVFMNPGTRQPMPGQALNYKTAWTIVMKRIGGEWKIVWGDIKVAGGDIDDAKMEEIKKASAALFAGG